MYQCGSCSSFPTAIDCFANICHLLINRLSIYIIPWKLCLFNYHWRSMHVKYFNYYSSLAIYWHICTDPVNEGQEPVTCLQQFWIQFSTGISGTQGCSSVLFKVTINKMAKQFFPEMSLSFLPRSVSMPKNWCI